MMVAYDHVNALGPGVFNLVDGLDAAVEGDDEGEAHLRRPVDALGRHAVSFIVPVRNVEVNVNRNLAQEGIDQRNGRSAVNIIVSVDEYLLSGGNRLRDAFHGLVHVLHQERVVQEFQARPEEETGLLECPYAPVDKQ